MANDERNLAGINGIAAACVCVRARVRVFVG